MRHLMVICGVLAGALVSGPAPVSAMGDDPPTTKSKIVCKKGYVYSKKKKRCVRQKTEIVPDRALIEQGWALAYQGEYQRALDLFQLVADKNDPKALNGLGFSHRKLGRLDRGIAYYQQAIAIDPDYLLAREYLGEGYVKAGKIDLAKAQLTEIKQRCGTSCKEYRLLARAISTGSENDW